MSRARVGAVVSVLLALFAAQPLPAKAAARLTLSRPEPGSHVIAYVRPGRILALRSRPFGRVLTHVGARTPFGSRRALAVVATRRGRWLGVTEAGVGGNRIVWLDASARGLRFARTDIELRVDLSSRMLSVRRDGVLLRRLRVAVGRYGAATPSGLFAVTDKLKGSTFSPVYGCCILALSAIQPNLPVGWGGGNRIAIHGTERPADLGRAVSAGCLHAAQPDLRYLMRVVPLGTPIVIRR